MELDKYTWERVVSQLAEMLTLEATNGEAFVIDVTGSMVYTEKAQKIYDGFYDTVNIIMYNAGIDKGE